MTNKQVRQIFREVPLKVSHVVAAMEMKENSFRAKLNERNYNKFSEDKGEEKGELSRLKVILLEYSVKIKNLANGK